MSTNSPFNHPGQASILASSHPFFNQIKWFFKYKCDPNCAQLNERMDLTSSYLKSFSTSSCPVTGGWRRARTRVGLLLPHCSGNCMWRRRRVRPWQARAEAASRAALARASLHGMGRAGERGSPRHCEVCYRASWSRTASMTGDGWQAAPAGNPSRGTGRVSSHRIGSRGGGEDNVFFREKR
jgi:hypothetical protein